MSRLVVHLLLLLSLGFSNPLQSQDDTTLVARSGIGVNGLVTLGEDRKSVEALLGRSDPYRCTKSRTVVKEDRRGTAKTVSKSWLGVQKHRSYYASKNLYINYGRDGRRQIVRSIEIEGPEYVTDRGVRVGSSIEQVTSAYGAFTGTTAKYQEGIEFFFADNKVAYFKLSRP